MRLKDKMGDKSNASSEIEYHGAWAERLGEEGRGVRTIIDMVQHTRYDCILGSTGGIRAALVQALWHTSQRLATDEHEAAFMRLATSLAKYWVCKRQPGFVYEALECHGGAGYVEEGPMPRLYRQSPLNAIWEGSGNVIALDVLRALSREPDSLEAVQAELKKPLGRHHAYDAHVGRLAEYLTPGNLHEGTARGFARDAALALQGAALHEMAPDFVFDAFCAQRLASDRNGLLYGDVSPDVDQGRLIERAIPAV